MIKKGVYAAGLSILNDDLSLDVKSTILHAEKAIKKYNIDKNKPIPTNL